MNDAHSDLTVHCYGEDGECDTTVTYEDDFVGLVRHRDMEMKALRLSCPECGLNHEVCPVCEGHGWYTGETTGKQLACHNCNQKEYRAQLQDPFF